MAINIDIIRRVEFAKPYSWEASFDGFPGPFLPCHVFNDTFLTFRNGTMEYGPWEFQFPERAHRGDEISLDFYELSDHVLYEWLREWKRKILTDNFTTALVGASGVTKKLTLQRLNPQRNPVSTEIMMVIPSGEITFNLSSEKGGSPLTLSATFAVVGIIQ
jgi:hypothetical protein